MPATILASMRDSNRVRRADKHEGENCNGSSLSSAGDLARSGFGLCEEAKVPERVEETTESLFCEIEEHGKCARDRKPKQRRCKRVV
jgi:hypothetical protein